MTNYRQTMADALELMYLMREYKLMERELTDAEKKKREEIAQDMDDADFKDRYGDRWKEVKMAVATKQAKKEASKETSGAPEDQYDDDEERQQSEEVDLDEAEADYTIVAIKNNKVVDQQHSIAKSEFKVAIKLFKKNNPGAKISIEDKGGKIVEKPKCKEGEKEPKNCTGTKLDKNDNPTVTYGPGGGEFPITVDAATGKIEVDTEKAFEEWVKGRTNTKGETVTVSDEEIEDVSEMKATQNNIDGGKVAGMVSYLSNVPAEATEGFRGGSIFVSTEVDEKGKPLPSYILDGHHRWAAMTTMDIANGGSGNVQMNVRRINMSSVELVDATNKFTSQFIQPKSAPARTGHELDLKPKFAELYYRMKK